MSNLLDFTPVVLVTYTVRVGDLIFPVTVSTITPSFLVAVRRARKQILRSGLTPLKLVSLEGVK